MAGLASRMRVSGVGYVGGAYDVCIVQENGWVMYVLQWNPVTNIDPDKVVGKTGAGSGKTKTYRRVKYVRGWCVVDG